MSHIARAADYIDLVQAHLDAAKDHPPEAPPEFLEGVQIRLHDLWLLLDDRARRRRTYDQPEEP